VKHGLDSKAKHVTIVDGDIGLAEFDV
jgi:hypothetical protein